MANITIEVRDNSAAYLKAVEAAIGNGVADLGFDLQSVARQAAPEKTGYLVGHITVRNSSSTGAYQADLTSVAVDPRTGNDYVDWMHNGRYTLGSKSRAKGMASSKIGKFRKRVGPNYLQGSGELAKVGYTSYMETVVTKVNMQYGG